MINLVIILDFFSFFNRRTFKYDFIHFHPRLLYFIDYLPSTIIQYGNVLPSKSALILNKQVDICIRFKIIIILKPEITPESMPFFAFLNHYGGVYKTPD